MAIRMRDGQTIVFIGDSITDCGRRDTQRPLGGGYVKLFADLVTVREPAKRVTIVNKGISGDRVTGLRNRWTDDVLRHRPDWLAIKIGINDLHSHWRNEKDTAVTPARFAEAYRAILERTRRELPRCRVLLIDPFYISSARGVDTQRGQVLALLPAYLAVVHALAREFRTRHVATHVLFQRLLQYYPADTFCPEPVHPNPTGHLAIAEAVYAALSA